MIFLFLNLSSQAIMASLALIGGFDPRPRLGAVLMDGGVVKKIDKKGKLVVQLTDHRETRKVSMMSLFSNYYIPRLEPDINFQVKICLFLQGLPLNDDDVRPVFPTFLVCGTLIKLCRY